MRFDIYVQLTRPTTSVSVVGIEGAYGAVMKCRRQYRVSKGRMGQWWSAEGSTGYRRGVWGSDEVQKAVPGIEGAYGAVMKCRRQYRVSKGRMGQWWSAEGSTGYRRGVWGSDEVQKAVPGIEGAYGAVMKCRRQYRVSKGRMGQWWSAEGSTGYRRGVWGSDEVQKAVPGIEGAYGAVMKCRKQADHFTNLQLVRFLEVFTSNFGDIWTWNYIMSQWMTKGSLWHDVILVRKEHQTPLTSISLF